MSRHAVVWLPDAEDQLAAIWLRANHRGAVTAAQTRIDRELAYTPENKGSEVAEGLRQIIIHPLKAFFEIHEADLKVEITAVDQVV